MLVSIIQLHCGRGGENDTEENVLTVDMTYTEYRIQNVFAPFEMIQTFCKYNT